MKKLLSYGFISLLIGTCFAQVGPFKASEYANKADDILKRSSAGIITSTTATDTLGGASARWAKLWADDIDTTTATIGGISSGALTIDVTDAEALLVRKAGDTGDVFTVNTDTSVVTVGGTFTDGTASLVGGSLTAVKLGTLTTNGFVKTGGADGTLSIDTSTYLTAEVDPLSATKALDNLASVAISESLVSDTALTDDLGTEAIPWLKGWFGSSLSFEGTTDDDFQTTITFTDPTTPDKTITFQDASGIVAMDATAVTDLEGDKLSITTGTLNVTETDSVVGAITGIVKANGAGVISAATDGTDYLSSTTGVTVDQTVGQTVGVTGARLVKLWATDITVTNAIVGAVTGNAGTVTNGVYTTDFPLNQDTTGKADTAGNADTVTNATLTTALTVDTGTVGLTGNVANTSVLTIGAGAVSVSGANTGDQTNISGNAGTITVDATTSDTTTFPAIFESDSGSLEPQTDAGLTYNADTNALSTTTFIGALTGQADTVSTITGLAPDTATTAAAQANITSLGTLTALTVDNVNIDGSTISGVTTDANTVLTAYAGKAIAVEGVSFDGGVVTGASSISSTAFVGALTGNADTVTGFIPASGSLTLSGADAVTLTTTAGTNVTLPTSGTLITESTSDTFTNKTLDANGTGNSITNLETADFAANVIDTDVTLAADSDTRVPSQKAIKNYVDARVGIAIDYFFNDTASDIGGIYTDMTNTALGGGESTIATAGLTAVTDDQALNNYATDVTGGLGILTLPAGIFDVHFHAEKTAGTSSVVIYAEIYKRAAGGAETLLVTTELTGAVTSKAAFDIHAVTTGDTDLLATDRLVVKLLANVGGGSGATVAIYQEGTTVSRLVIPTTTEILSQIFVRQDGTKALTANWDAGSFKITAETLESDVTTGTPPLVVASTTEVTNLKAATATLATEATDTASKTGTGSTYATNTSPTFVTPILGTPTSGTLTNCDGTASGLTAGTVTTNANLTGVVTSTGNATAIADKALAIAKLADGTDGELITWDASGVIAAVAAGTATQVLTSNGAGFAPTFQAAGGGGLAGTSIKTIGTDGDYTDVAAFLAGESTPYHGVFVSNITEDSDIAIDGVVVLDIGSYNYTMGTNSFTYAAATNIYIYGDGVDSGAEINYTGAVGDQKFENASHPTSITEIHGLVLDNNSGNQNTYLSDAIERIYDARIELADASSTGFNADLDDCAFHNVHFVGGGTSTHTVIKTTEARTTASNLTFTGTYKDGLATGDPMFSVYKGNVFNNLTFEHATNDAAVNLQANGIMSNVISGGSVGLDIRVNGNNTQLINTDLLSGTLNIVDNDFGQYTNVRTTGLLDLTGAGAVNNLFTNCKFGAAITLAGDRNKFNNCDFVGGGSASSGALNNIFTGCQFGADAGGGALTFTLDSGADSNIVTSSISDAEIVDNGESNTVTNNVVY